MTLFFRTVSVEDAVKAAQSIAPLMEREDVPLTFASGRVLASDIAADIDIPGFTRATMDGYALVSSDTIGASESLPAMLHRTGMVGMGTPAGMTVGPGTCVYVPTGGAIPGGADGLAMIEVTESIGDDVLVRRPVAVGENIMVRGEDFTRGSVVIARGTRLSARDIGALAAVGTTLVPVRKQPVVGIISTGNELVPVSQTPAGGQVRDINSYLVGAYLASQGCLPEYFGIVPDDRSRLQEFLDKALHRCDAVVLSGGSSKDDRDMTVDIIRDAGEVLVHGVSIAPGKPTIIGRARGKPVIGLPGHPASSLVVSLVIVRPLLAAMTGQRESRLPTRQAILAENISSMKGREDYVRVRLSEGMAFPEFGKSGLINTLIRSDGLVRIPPGVEGLEEGDVVEVIIW
ncbi:MAG TPA: molybdopterin molybdotransferase MoeA [Methanoregulaceae archaeon]|nr:MAG: molybdopterin molybdotransferase MoeA [Methanolinea sp.]HON81438.1 molybdopterin molybdotransferase MoeA [Methanoregulaceae archaeon]HPD10034.1 molybdopterin molybdotransferase MoeA [Methanoregulaceae archaeon]HRT15040.1 molybdopterin molybdotransferase MoeA [Methanoregulaceae archaeon]HRU30611.1 molybdopterin molybdotransferase MoeA [Methanoregulaceae archaeon]